MVYKLIKKKRSKSQSYYKKVVNNIVSTVNAPKKYTRAFPSRYDNHSFYISK